jgi:D-arabinose 1-dehydrogenase-like Zn-dependent alcohol dehydrogenase
VEEVPIPKPKVGEVLVRVAACGVCHTDLHVIKGEVAFPTPCVLGHEISGVVAEVGPGVEGLEVGTEGWWPASSCPAAGATTA